MLPGVVVVQLDLSAAAANGSGGKRRREVQTDEVRQWGSGAGLPDSAMIEVSARDGTDVLAVFHRLIGQATSSVRRLEPLLRRRRLSHLEPLLRRRLSGNSARLSAARARLRDKSGDRDGGQPTLLQVADTVSRLLPDSATNLIRRGRPLRTLALFCSNDEVCRVSRRRLRLSAAL